MHEHRWNDPRPGSTGPWGRSRATAAIQLLLASLLATTVAAGPAALPEFERQAVIPAPGVDFVRVGDLDGDGRIDFVGRDTEFDRGTGDPIEKRLKWWRQEAPAPGEPAGQAFAREISLTAAPRELDLLLAVGDVDGDGHLDILAYSPSRGALSLWLNEDGSAAFSRRSTGLRNVVSGADHIELADSDGDGRDDLLVVRKNDDILRFPSTGTPGDASFGAQERIARLGRGDQEVTRLDAGDLDGDGRLDLATASRDGDSISWWLQQPDGSFARTGTASENEVRDLTLADLDRDGDLDIAVTSQEGSQPYQLFAWLNEGDGQSFSRDEGRLHRSQSANHKWSSVDAADVNGDGAVDIIAPEFTESSPSGRLCWYENPLAANPPPSPSPSPTASVLPTRPNVTPSAMPTATPSLTATATPSPTSTETSATTRIFLPFARRG